MTSVIANDCFIPATKVAEIKQSLVITLVIRNLTFIRIVNPNWISKSVVFRDYM